MEQFSIGFKNIAKFGIIFESYRLLEFLLSKKYNFKVISSYHLDYDWYILSKKNGSKEIKIAVAVSQGAPMVVDLAERYVVSGISKIVRIGTTGSLVDNLKLGDVIVPYAAIKDEGTSNFYINSNAPAIADINFSQEISRQIKKRGKNVHQGIVWSTDGRWKETDEMINKYISSGAISADMESSALFAFGLNKKISVASVSVLSDEIHKDLGNGPKGLSDKDVWFNMVLPTFGCIFDAVTDTFLNIKD